MWYMWYLENTQHQYRVFFTITKQCIIMEKLTDSQEALIELAHTISIFFIVIISQVSADQLSCFCVKYPLQNVQI